MSMSRLRSLFTGVVPVIPVILVMPMVGLLGTPVAAGAQSASGATQQVTFSRDVVRILQRKCQVCHRPGSIAPMSLLTYESARPWARAMKQQVLERAMPPWYVDRTVGIQQFKADRSLSDQEIETIVTWVDAGAPRGDPADLPPPLEFPDQSKLTLLSTLGEPDIIYGIPEPFVIDAEGANIWVDLFSDPGITEDRWIRAVETKPSLTGFPVVHHSSTWMFDPSAPDDFSNFSEYALGKTGDVFADGAGRFLKAGTQFRFNIHYAPNGTATTDQTSVALWLYPKGYEPKYQHVRRGIGGVSDLDIPPGEISRHDGYTVLTENVRMTAYQPHLHNRGKRQCLETISPTGRIETVNCVDWNFGWHITYNYATDVQPLLPKGTVLHITTWHDNTAANKWNPDPTNWVGYGQRSSDDMAFAWISWFALSDEEFEQHVEERRRTQGAAPASNRE